MEKRYYFKLRLVYKEGKPILNIKPVSYFQRLIPYPINFSELNVPIIVNKKERGLEYYLDFENSFTGNGRNYGKAYSLRIKLNGVLKKLAMIADEDIKKALNEEGNLNGKRFGFKEDNGFSDEEYKGRFARFRRCRKRGSMFWEV